MGSLQAESEEKLEMDDSGCIQDETPPYKRYNGYQGVHLLDLSDDVLLLILRFLTPRDLKALGYTCPRLGLLVLDRSLWVAVDARAQPWSRARLRWYLARALHAGTRELLLAGYARPPDRHPDHETQSQEEVDSGEDNNKAEDGEEDSHSGQSDRSQSLRVIEVPALGPNARLILGDAKNNSETWACSDLADGDEFPLTAPSLRQLADTCPALTSLGLEYCNINCNTISITHFPPTLKKLSLRGSKCYNQPHRSFLFKIQDTMPDLESLDVSECEWMEPASLLPLSKLLSLRELCARDCLRLTEFVAYASLATRYGFTKLECLDLRGSPVGDSEVSALGWLPRLARLWLAPASANPHPRRAPLRRGTRADEWEATEPDYFKIKDFDCDQKTERCDAEENKHTWQAIISKGLNGSVASYNSSPSSASNSIISSPCIPTASNNPTESPQSSSQASPGRSNSPKQSPGQSTFQSVISISVKQPAAQPNSSQQSPVQSESLQQSPAQSISFTQSLGNSNSQQSLVKSNSSQQSSGKSNSAEQSPNPSSKAPKRKPCTSPGPGPSKRKRDGSEGSDDDEPSSPIKDVNEGASTSREEPQEQEEPAQNAEAQPRHHVLYVNVGQQVHAVYRLSLDNEHIVTFNRNPNVRRINNNPSYIPPHEGHIDASSLVTDCAIRRFGRADGVDINYIHIGPNGPYPAASSGARPDRSSLTHLTVTGFRYITDSSLNHLATAAPRLRFLDLSETNVTDQGVANFRSLRPDCEVRYSKYVKKD